MSRKTTPYSNVVRIQNGFMVNITTCSISYEFWVLTSQSKIKCASSDYKIFQGQALSTVIMAKNILAKLIRVYGSVGLGTCTTWNLYGYHFTMDWRTFRILDQKKDKTRDNTIVDEKCEPDAFSTTARPISSEVLFEIRFWSLLCCTHNSPVLSFLYIIYCNACLDIGPFKNCYPFKRQYSCNAIEKLQLFW